MNALMQVDSVSCGSWLACDSGVSGAECSACLDLIAGKPAPTEKPEAGERHA